MPRRDAWALTVLGLIVLVFLYMAFVWSPPDVALKDLVRILYFHVASAWLAFLSFGVTALAAIWYLVARKSLADWIAVSSAEIGVVYTTMTLVTGSLWARPLWNTWWTWDPRLTTTLILWFLYVAYLLLRGTITSVDRRARVSAVFAIIAFVDVPIVHFSVTWWRSIHPLVITETGFNMPEPMVVTLMTGFFVFLCIYLVLLWIRVRQERQVWQLKQLRESVRSVRDLSTRRHQNVQ